MLIRYDDGHLGKPEAQSEKDCRGNTATHRMNFKSPRAAQDEVECRGLLWANLASWHDHSFPPLVLSEIGPQGQHDAVAEEQNRAY